MSDNSENYWWKRLAQAAAEEERKRDQARYVELMGMIPEMGPHTTPAEQFKWIMELRLLAAKYGPKP